MTTAHNQIVDRQFGPRAQAYVTSATHATGPDLERLSQIAREFPDATALDLGCGGGHAAYALAPHVARVVACDLSGEMVAAVAAEADRRDIANITTCRAAAEQLPFADGTFDLLACRMSAHHWHDFETGLREARRVLKSSASAVFIDVVAPAHPLLDTHLQAVELLRDPSHVRDYRVEEWSAALGRTGFELQRMAVHSLPMEFGSWVARMETPPDHVAAIRSLQAGASEAVRGAFDILDDGSFTIKVTTFEAVASPQVSADRQP